MDNHKYLIIGGSTKCGTTSAYKYFEFHPEICPCLMKESRYFLDDSYPLVAAGRDHNKYQSFGELFKHCRHDGVRLEATPDYLYSITSMHKIKAELQNCKLVFILRDPVERLVSWYKFASLNGLIEKTVTIEDFIDLQKENYDDSIPQHLRALEQGKYYSYLKSYIDAFGVENVSICFYEELKANAELFCKSICRFSGISESYFENFNFIVYNKSVPVKSVGMHQLFRKLKRGVRPVARMLPKALHKKLKLAGYKVEKAYTTINENPDTGTIRIPEHLWRKLMVYYFEDVAKINNLTGKQAPWKNFITS